MPQIIENKTQPNLAFCILSLVKELKSYQKKFSVSLRNSKQVKITLANGYGNCTIEIIDYDKDLSHTVTKLSSLEAISCPAIEFVLNIKDFLADLKKIIDEPNWIKPDEAMYGIVTSDTEPIIFVQDSLVKWYLKIQLTPERALDERTKSEIDIRQRYLAVKQEALAIAEANSSIAHSCYAIRVNFLEGRHVLANSGIDHNIYVHGTDSYEATKQLAKKILAEVKTAGIFTVSVHSSLMNDRATVSPYELIRYYKEDNGEKAHDYVANSSYLSELIMRDGFTKLDLEQDDLAKCESFDLSFMRLAKYHKD